MVRIERSMNTFPERVRFFANEDNYKRQMITAYCYPKYDQQIRVTANCIGLGFTLELEDAKHLRDILDHAIRTLE